MTNTYKYALGYLKRGISFYPVKRNSKISAIKWREYQNRLPTKQEVFDWFVKCKYDNIALITGKVSNLIIIDCDDDIAIEMWQYICKQNNDLESFQTVQVKTKRGQHFYYRYPENEIIKTTPNHFGKYVKIEIKSDKCSAKAPPSYFIDSQEQYSFLDDYKEIKPFPNWLVKELKPMEIANTKIQNIRYKGNGRYWLEKAIQKAVIGNRNFVCVWLSDQLRDDRITLEEAKEIVKEFAKQVNDEFNPYTEEQALTTLYSRYQLPPRNPASRKVYY